MASSSSGSPLQKEPLPIACALAVSCSSPVLALAFTNPFDVVKTRLQVQTSAGPQTNFARAMSQMVRTEGIRSIYSGFQAAAVREASLNFFRLGFFHPVLNMLHDPSKGPSPFSAKISAGGITAVLGAIASNPFEVVKTRLQVAPGSSAGQAYTGSSDAFVSIAKNEGLRGFCRGMDASCLRIGVMGSINMGTKTQVEELLLAEGWTTTPAVMISSMISGLACVVVGCPLDVVRTRIYTQPVDSSGVGTLYRNPVDAAVKIVSKEGFMSLYKGFIPLWLRLGPHVFLTFTFHSMLMRKSTHIWNDRLEDIEIKHLFDKFDRNKSGVIDYDDMVGLFEQLHPSLHPKNHAPGKPWLATTDELFNDTTGGQPQGITLEKFRRMAPLAKERRRQLELTHLFRRMDADGDGFIGRMEFRSCFLHAGNAYLEEDLDSLRRVADVAFDRIDISRKGQISFDAYLQAADGLEQVGLDTFVSFQLAQIGYQLHCETLSV